jgi:predicted O-methyltransferase YrrM
MMRNWTFLVLLGIVAALAFCVQAATAQAPAGAKQRPEGRDFRPPMPPVMAALDADGDGTISGAEIQGAQAALKKLDRDNDGQLSREEIGFGRGRFGGGPGRFGPGGPRGPGQGPPGAREAGESLFESAPVPKDEAEKKILAILDDMDQNQRRGMMNVPKEDGRLLRLLAEAVGAKHVVEIGTSNGYSGIWWCLALRTTGGKLTTYEIDARRASLARESFKRAGVDNLVTLVEGDAHDEVTKLTGPIDVLFLDADKSGYIDYLEKLLPLVRPGGLVVAHNMSMRSADPRYVEAITTDPDLETIFLHMDAAGVGVSMKKR